jgi:Fe-S-cluster containining protein
MDRKKKEKKKEHKSFLQVPMKRSKVNRISKHFEALHRRLDEVMIEAEKKFTINCKKGCSSCCKQAVTLSVPEAIAMIAPIIFNNNRLRYYIKNTFPKIKQQSQWCFSGKVNVQSWFEREISCVFLQNDLCTVYSTRPSTCRVHAVMSSPELCSPPRKACLSKVDVVNWCSATEDLVDRVGRENQVTTQMAPLPVAVLWATTAMLRGGDYLRRELGESPIFSDDKLAAMWWGLRFIAKDQWRKSRGGDDESRKQV